MTEIHLPTRAPHNRAMAATLQIWHNRDRGLIQRTLDGLKAMDHPAACRSGAPINGYAHAHQVMAAHAKHRGCPRYQAAFERTQQERP
ncbi:hypothetical protein [Nocardia fusca]|uniref:Uncharacterized protein n=1 Tax=Nocardia fusca TaxID=941183 RepID=A0ABV3FII8_9NOCA